MAEFVRRHRRKILAAVAVGGAAYAVTSIYHWWTSSEQPSDDRPPDAFDDVLDALARITDSRKRCRHGQPHAGLGPEQAGAGPEATDAAGSSGGMVNDEETLQRHIASMRQMTDTEVRRLLPELKEVLLKETPNASGRPVQLSKAGASDDAAAEAERVALWRRLAHDSFTRALSACWLVALLDVLVRLKLHIISRHTYLESTLPAMQPKGAAGVRPLDLFGRPAAAARVQMPPRLNARAEEEFFNSRYFINHGARGIITKMGVAVDRVLDSVTLERRVTPADVEAMVAEIHAHFTAGFESFDDLWHKYLLPPGQQPISIRTPSGVEAFISPIEAAMVDQLNLELRDATADYRFYDALRAAVQYASCITGEYASSRLVEIGRKLQQAAQQQGSPPSETDRPAAPPGGLSSSQLAPPAVYGARPPTPPHSRLSYAGALGTAHDHLSQQQQQARQAPGSGSNVAVAGSGVGEPASSTDMQAGAVQRGQQALDGPAMPFAYAIPIMKQSCSPLFDPDAGVSRGITTLQQVQAMCTAVFTFAPRNS